MARFKSEVPLELMKQFDNLSKNSEKMLGEMTEAGAKVVYENIKANMHSAFKNTSELEKHLLITKVYKNKKGAIGNKVGFAGYKKKDGGYSMKKGKRSYTYEGVPIPLIIVAREYGTSRGEAKKPFIRPAFKKAMIESAMLGVQKKYIKDDE